METPLKGIVNKIIPFSAVDGPGNRTVIFLQGCNMNCAYCHNPETINYCTHCGICVEGCPSDALQIIENKVVYTELNCTQCDRCIKICPSNSSPKTKLMSVSEIFEIIDKTKPFISGITVSGGECTAQYDFLIEILKEAQRQKISAFIDTNASLPEEKMIELSQYFDKAMPDFKAWDEKDHLQLTGIPTYTIHKNIEYLLKHDKVHEIRTVIYPALVDNERTIRWASFLIRKWKENVPYKLIKYRRNGTRNSSSDTEPSDELMQHLAQFARENGCLDVTIL